MRGSNPLVVAVWIIALVFSVASCGGGWVGDASYARSADREERAAPSQKIT